MRRLAEILREYGTVVEGEGPAGARPVRTDGVWWISIEERLGLRVEETALPEALARLLALHVEMMAADDGERAKRRRAVEGWLVGEHGASAAAAAVALQELGWQAEDGALVIAMELQKAEGGAVEEAVAMLAELMGEAEEDGADDSNADGVHPAPLVVKGRSNGSPQILVLVPACYVHAVASPVSGEMQGELQISAWLDTLSAELYVLAQAGVSSVVTDFARLEQAREQALFALAAGRAYRSKESLHPFARLGLARVLYGLPAEVREAFLLEVLPQDVLGTLSPELRETIFAFLEHGQQVADTARSLYIHRNTLLYRLDRVTELTGYDLRKPLEGWTLWLALTLSRSL